MVHGLYYPYFNVRDERWLKIAALYWPRIVRLIPEDFRGPDSQAVRALTDELDFVDRRPPGLSVENVAPLFMNLITERFRCRTPGCVRRTFVEQVEGLSTRYARASPGLTALWRPDCGGTRRPPGSAAVPGTDGTRRAYPSARPDRQPAEPGQGAADPGGGRLRVQEGHDVWDDLGRCAGRSTGGRLAGPYERNPGRVVDCASRSSDRVPGSSRGVFEGDRPSRAGAVEVADRWHFLQNLAAAVERTCHQHRSRLRGPFWPVSRSRCASARRSAPACISSRSSDRSTDCPSAAVAANSAY